MKVSSSHKTQGGRELLMFNCVKTHVNVKNFFIIFNSFALSILTQSSIVYRTNFNFELENKINLKI